MSLFSQSYKPLAASLQGKKLRFDGKEFEILDAQGFSRRENEAPLYRPVLTMQPGGVYCPRHRGAVLLLIACNDGASPGGCVLVKKIQVDETVHKGPGKVTEALGLTEHGMTGTLVETKTALTLKL